TKGETLADVCWHPVRPIIASMSSGVVSVWSHSQVENWSAFAPDFRELEENVEYHERESEFDVKDEDRSLDASDYASSPSKRQHLDTNGNVKKFNSDDIEIDVVTQQRIEALVSSDDEDINDQLVYLPTAPDIEDVEVDVTSTQKLIETGRNYEIKLQTPPVYDAHPYFGGTKQTRSIGNLALNNQDVKKDGRFRRKGNSIDSDQPNVLLPKSIDAAIATVSNNIANNNLKRFTPSNVGNSTIVTQTSESKGQRGRSARLEGRKANTGQHRSSTDNDMDFVPN
ncbi:unnamed protein product, partial [Rotaria magnacalcarata]